MNYKIVRYPGISDQDKTVVLICDNIRDEYHAKLLSNLLNKEYVNRQSWDGNCVYRAVHVNVDMETLK